MIKKKLNAVWNFMEKSMPSVEFVFDGKDKPVSMSLKKAADLVEDRKKFKSFLETNIKKGKANGSKSSEMDRPDSE